MTANMRSVPLPHVGAGSVIPPIIHQIYLRGSARRESAGDLASMLPDVLRRNVANLKAMNGAWEHRLYDDAAAERFIRDQYGLAMLRLFHAIDPAYGAARADLLRYLLVYRLGGVYLDLKSRFEKPIDQVIDRSADRFVVSQWSNGPGERYELFGLHDDVAQVDGGEYQQWHVIAAPGSPFLRAVLERVCGNIVRYRLWRDAVGGIGVLRLTGPIAYTFAINPLLGMYPHRRVRREAELGLEFSVLPQDRHHGLFGQHYTQSGLPIVRHSGPTGWASQAYYRARKLRHRIRLPGARAG
jgi:hypothetical protein